MKNITKIKNQFLLLLLIISEIAFFSGCGKRRPPMPPSQTVSANNLTATQQGNRIILKIALPPPVKSLKQINIYRLNETQSTSGFLSEDDFTARSTLIGSITSLNTPQPSSVIYSDVLSSITSATKLRYSVRLIFQDGRRSSLSNFLMIEPSFQVPQAPTLNGALVQQSEIRLSWLKPEANLDETKPARVSGYNIYRVSGGGEPDQPDNLKLLNPTPITETSFVDRKFEFPVNYQYFVRAVTVNANSVPIESLNSNAQVVTASDTFPPAAPQGLTIAAAPNRLSLFFAANSEPDVSGYLIYRSSDEKTPLSEWRKLTPSPLTATSFQDATVEAGQKYFYYLKAIDKAGNISEPSDIVSETAP